MRRHSLLLLLTTAIAPAQTPPAAKDPDPRVAAILAALREIGEDLTCARDTEGVDLVTELVQRWRTGLGNKDQKDVVELLGQVLLRGKLRPADRIQLYLAAAAALGETGAAGADPLEKAFASKRFPSDAGWLPLRAALLRAVGNTGSEDHVEFLVDVAVRDTEAKLQATAGQALANFADARQPLRRDIVSRLFVKYGELERRARPIDPADIQAQNARERLAILRDDWHETLGALTGVAFDRYLEWQQSYNKNKNERWQ